MTLPRRLLLLTFLESFATTLVERGMYFFSHDRLGFTDALNLWLALAFGLAYVAGAFSSHKLSRSVAEKPLLALAVGSQIALQVALAAHFGAAILFAGGSALAFAFGVKWPLVETFVSANQSPAANLRTIGRFNVAWASAVPVGMVVAGPIIAAWPQGLFLLGAGVNVVSLFLLRPLAVRPAHMAHDHPDRPAGPQLKRYRGLLTTSRWQMLGSYAMMWILAALMPGVFASLGFSVATAPALAGLLDACRLIAFASLSLLPWWHNRLSPLVVTLAALPGGFFLVLFGHSPAVVLAGEVLFGLAAGQVYYAALYYAMVVKNASVDAGGAHEGLIGVGFAIGPAAGLTSLALMPLLGSYSLGLLAGVGPVLAVCSAGALWPMRRTHRTRQGQAPPTLGEPPPLPARSQPPAPSSQPSASSAQPSASSVEPLEQPDLEA